MVETIWNKNEKKKKITGVTLIDALQKIVGQPKKQADKPFHVPVSGVYTKFISHGDVITGRIEHGRIVTYACVMVRFYPPGAKGKAFDVAMHHKNVTQSVCGDNANVGVESLTKDNIRCCWWNMNWRSKIRSK